MPGQFLLAWWKKKQMPKSFWIADSAIVSPLKSENEREKRRQSGIVPSINCMNVCPSNASQETRGDSMAADSSVMDMQQTLFQLSFLSSYLHLYSIPAVSYSIIFQLSLSQSLPRS